MHRKIKIPVVNWYILLHPARKACEHLTLAGAVVDCVAFIAHVDWFVFVLSGKVAFALGAVGVILLHREERFQAEQEKKGVT